MTFASTASNARGLARRLAATLAACGLAASAAAQTAVSTSFEQRDHVAAVRGERTADFLAAWENASPAARDAARGVLAAHASAAKPLGGRPRLPALAAATRALAGEAADDLTAFADSLDLQVRPGAFAAVERDMRVGPPSDSGGDGPDGDARGAPLVVRVHRLHHLPRAGEVELSLVWLGPSGERIHARREPFAAEAFRGRGFDVYVRAPMAEPGVWRLQPIVRRDGREVAGAAVPVACVARLEERRAGLAEDGDAAAGRAALDDLIERGLRRPEAPTGADLLAILEHGVWTDAVGGEPAANANPGVARGARLVGLPASRAAVEVSSPSAGEAPSPADGKAPSPAEGKAPSTAEGGAFVFLWSGDDDEDLPLLGPAGDRWRALAERHGFGLFSLAVGAGDVSAVRAGLGLAARRSGGPPILVARATAATQAMLLLAMTQAEPLELAGLVFVQPIDTPPRALPDAPVLAVLARTDSPTVAPEGVAIRRLPAGPLFGELELPGLVEEWLAAD